MERRLEEALERKWEEEEEMMMRRVVRFQKSNHNSHRRNHHLEEAHRHISPPLHIYHKCRVFLDRSKPMSYT